MYIESYRPWEPAFIGIERKIMKWALSGDQVHIYLKSFIWNTCFKSGLAGHTGKNSRWHLPLNTYSLSLFICLMSLLNTTPFISGYTQTKSNSWDTIYHITLFYLPKTIYHYLKISCVFVVVLLLIICSSPNSIRVSFAQYIHSCITKCLRDPGTEHLFITYFWMNE